MQAGDVETFFVDDAWQNRIIGFGRVVGQYSTMEDAIRLGRDLARTLRVDHCVAARRPSSF